MTAVLRSLCFLLLKTAIKTRESRCDVRYGKSTNSAREPRMDRLRPSRMANTMAITGTTFAVQSLQSTATAHAAGSFEILRLRMRRC